MSAEEEEMATAPTTAATKAKKGEPPELPDLRTKLAKAEKALEDAEEELKAAGAEIKSWSKKVSQAIEKNDANAEAKAREREAHFQGERAHFQGRVAELKQEIEKFEARIRKIEDKRLNCLDYADPADIVEKLVGPDLEELPSLDSLTRRLERKVPAVFKISQWEMDGLKKASETFYNEAITEMRFFTISANEKPCPPTRFAAFPFFNGVWKDIKGGSEDSVHHLVDSLLTDPLRFLMETMEIQFAKFSRNTAERRSYSTTAPMKRPDWLFYLKNLLVWRGEEKGNEEYFDDAGNELTSKMEGWNSILLGELPYIFGFALAETHFQLFALAPVIEGGCGVDKYGVRPVSKHPIGKLLDLSKLEHRLILCEYVFNLAKVLKLMCDRIPGNLPPMETTWNHGSSKLKFSSTYLVKTVRNEAPNNYDTLKEVYQHVRKGTIKNTIQIYNGYPKLNKKSTEIELKLHPLGKINRFPQNADELLKFSLDILGALNSLHTTGFCHRDIRPANVIQIWDDHWLLIDLELCGEMTRGECDWPTWNNDYIPSRNTETRGWSPCHDLWQLARLIDEMVGHKVDNADNVAHTIRTSPSASVAIDSVTSLVTHQDDSSRKRLKGSN